MKECPLLVSFVATQTLVGIASNLTKKKTKKNKKKMKTLFPLTISLISPDLSSPSNAVDLTSLIRSVSLRDRLSSRNPKRRR
ncbi:hypothetical protein Scep_003052 [Stephania cephalantha]|uniref:Uncharacterized protein n=1 Tax=Stephania cephalantha TaxID=152367 RepID=A0AAP0KPT3_9MAGN